MGQNSPCSHLSLSRGSVTVNAEVASLSPLWHYKTTEVSEFTELMVCSLHNERSLEATNYFRLCCISMSSKNFPLQDYRLLEYDAVYSCRNVSMFRRTLQMVAVCPSGRSVNLYKYQRIWRHSSENGNVRSWRREELSHPHFCCLILDWYTRVPLQLILSVRLCDLLMWGSTNSV
jgi:hypothetical protein